TRPPWRTKTSSATSVRDSSGRCAPASSRLWKPPAGRSSATSAPPARCRKRATRSSPEVASALREPPREPGVDLAEPEQRVLRLQDPVVLVREIHEPRGHALRLQHAV